MGESISKYGTRSTWRANREAAMKESMAGDVLKSLRSRRRELTAQKHDTESGMTAAQKTKALDLENSVQSRATEKGYVIDANGRVTDESHNGTGTSAKFSLNPFKDYSNSYLIHNHPSATRDEQKNMEEFLRGQLRRYARGMGIKLTSDALRRLDPDYYDSNVARRKETISTRVGVTLSPDDLMTASSHNMKGVRARSEGGFIYSIERGQNGWGASPNVLGAKLDRYVAEERGKNRAYIEKAKNWRDKQERNAKSEVMAQHRALTRLAKEYGLKYTRRKA